MKERVVLAYAGGLETSEAIPWLAETYGAEVVTLTLDLGQGRDLEEIRDRALAAGAVRAHVLDVREEFAHDFVLPALQAGALHEGRDPMAAALARPLMARKLLEIASIEQTTAIAHGCTGLDQERMAESARALNPHIRVIAVAGAAAPPQRTHANLWGRGYTSTKSQTSNLKSQIPDPESQVPTGAQGSSASVEIAFERGVPAAINGVPMALTELIESLSIIALQHGVGLMAGEESDEAGSPWRHAYEAPAAVVLHAAHAALETSLVPPELTRLKRDRAAEYAHLVYGGQWFTGAREAMDALNAVVQERVTGSVRITLLKGTLLTSEAAGIDAARGPAAVART